MKVWGDDRFRRLSRPAPSAQFLWLYLITGPHTNSLPGLFRAGEAAMAEDLEWPLDEFRKCFLEIRDQGMAHYDPETRLVYLPRGVHHNPPESPNVVRHWGKSYVELPECALRQRAGVEILRFLEGYGIPFAKAFREGYGESVAVAVTGAVAVPGSKETQVSFENVGWKLTDEIDRAIRKTRFKALVSDARWWQAQFRAHHRARFAKEILEAEAWCTSHSSRAPKKDFRRFLNYWFKKAHEEAE